jgi:hypothetical protein
MIGVSLGGFSSNLTTGWLMEEFGATAPARISGIAALLLATLVPLILPPTEPGGSVD